MTMSDEETDLAARLAAARRNVLATIADERTPRFSRRGKLAVVAGAGALALGVTGGAIAIAAAPPEAVAYSVQCYEAADLGSRYTTLGHPIAIDDATGEEQNRDTTDPVADCGEMWRMGVVGQDEVPDDPNAAQFPVPELVGCTLPSGVGAAFPRGESSARDDEFCGALGLAVWAG